jgi:hypothetical protein
MSDDYVFTGEYPVNGSEEFNDSANWIVQGSGATSTVVPGADDTIVFESTPYNEGALNVTGLGSVAEAEVYEALYMVDLNLTATTLAFETASTPIFVDSGSSLTVGAITGAQASLLVEDGSLTTKDAIGPGVLNQVDVGSYSTWTAEGEVIGGTVSSSGVISGGQSMLDLTAFLATGGSVDIGDLSASGGIWFLSNLNAPGGVATVGAITLLASVPADDAVEMGVGCGFNVSAQSVTGPAAANDEGLLYVDGSNPKNSSSQVTSSYLKVNGEISGFAKIDDELGGLIAAGSVDVGAIYIQNAVFEIAGNATASSETMTDGALTVGGVDTVSGPMNIDGIFAPTTLVSDDGLTLGGGADVTIGTYEAGAIVVNGARDWLKIEGAPNTVNITLSGADSKLFLDDAVYQVAGSGETFTAYDATLAVTGDDDIFNLNATSTLYLSSSSSNVWSTINGSYDAFILNEAQANVVGEGDTIQASDDTISLGGNAGGAADVVDGNGATISVLANSVADVNGSDAVTAAAGATLNVTGGGETISSDRRASANLFDTDGDWDLFHGSYDTVGVNDSQVSVIGRSDTVAATAGSLVRLANTGTDDDIVSGSNDTLVLNNAEATLNGSSDTIRFSSSDALIANGQSEAFVFGAALGVSSITGFETSERLRLSASDWSNFAALQASHDLFQSGANTVIEISASDMLTLVDTQVSQLSATNVKFQ